MAGFISKTDVLLSSIDGLMLLDRSHELSSNFHSFSGTMDDICSCIKNAEFISSLRPALLDAVMPNLDDIRHGSVLVLAIYGSGESSGALPLHSAVAGNGSPAVPLLSLRSWSISPLLSIPLLSSPCRLPYSCFFTPASPAPLSFSPVPLDPTRPEARMGQRHCVNPLLAYASGAAPGGAGDVLVSLGEEPVPRSESGGGRSEPEFILGSTVVAMTDISMSVAQRPNLYFFSRLDSATSAGDVLGYACAGCDADLSVPIYYDLINSRHSRKLVSYLS